MSPLMVSVPLLFWMRLRCWEEAFPFNWIAELIVRVPPLLRLIALPVVLPRVMVPPLSVVEVLASD